MDKLKMQSPNLVDDNIDKIAKIFPNCITETHDENGNVRRAVDFDLLRQELSLHLVEGTQERYTLNWPGKSEAILAANAPVAKTLRPCEEESVNFDTTQNLFIEGDNLDVLKLLQETYLNKVKMIYIDPPYNTGKDFIYEDDFAEDTDSFLKRSNQKDEEGNRLVANTDSNGRFHSDWLSMMYPRLKLARNLLGEDGVIFISIDDNEVHNLRKMCDEIFGQANFCGQVTVLCNPKGRSQDKYLATCHEYLLMYSKVSLPKGSLSVPKLKDEIASDYPLQDERGLYRELELRNTHREFGKHNRPNLYYPFYVSSNGKVNLESCEGAIAVTPDWEDGFKGCWTWGKEKSKSKLEYLVAKLIRDNWKIYRKGYASELNEVPLKQLKSLWLEKRYHTEKGQSIFNELFEVKQKIFQSPKSLDVLINCLSMSQNKDSIILDFFSGSATTAHAVMQLNAEDGGNRKFIMVQLPEPCDEKSEAFKAGYKTIAEIGKERIRRAGKKVVSDKWEVISREEKIRYGCKELSRTNCVAKGDGVSQGDLFVGQKTTKGGAIQPVRPNAAGGSVNSIEHSGGTGLQLDQGVSTVSGNSQGIKSGVGDATSSLRESGIPCRYGYFGNDAALTGDRENGVCSYKNTIHCPLTTKHCPDTGFRVFKVDSSNMKDVYYTPDEVRQEQLTMFKENIKEDRRPEDLLFQVFLDWGLELTLPVAKETIEGKTVFFVDNNVLAACFDTGVTEELVKILAKRKPLRAVFRDSSYGSDNVKINVEQIFKLLSPGTEVRTI